MSWKISKWPTHLLWTCSVHSDEFTLAATDTGELGKRSYTRQQVVDILLNDSDSEGPNDENDSDESSDSLESQISDGFLSNQSSRPQTPSENTESGSETADSGPDEQPNQLTGRGRGRRRGGARVRAGPRLRGGRVPAQAGRMRGRGGRMRGNNQGNVGDRERAQPVGQNVDQREPGFEWLTYDWQDPFTPDWLQDFTAPRGVLVDTSDFDPVDYFKLFFPDQAIQLICDETNRYATQFFDNPADLPRFSRFLNWEETNVPEIQAYLALQTAMGLCQKHKIEDYWATFWLTKLPYIDVMSRNRYELLTSFLHFANNGVERPARDDPAYDPLWKIRPLRNLCEPKYLDTFGPGCNLSIDESLIRFKGRVSFRQYLPAKPYKWGIKQYALCDSKTGFALKFLTYCGKGTIAQLPGFSITESICLQLLNGFENKGYKLFTDNYYTSPTLFRELHNRQIGASGTVKAGRKGMPQDLQPQRLHLDKGEDPVFMRANDMVSGAWHDTKRVHFLSTTESNNTVDKRIRQRGAEGGYRTVEKPVVAEVYNKNMDGVDLLDQKLGTYAYPHKSSKWYSTIFHRLREVAFTNAYVVYKAGENNKLLPWQFREQVINGLLEGYINPSARRGRPSATDAEARLTERHFVGEIDDKKFRPDCAVCSSRTTLGWKRKQTVYKCKQCDIPMCPVPCHELYHTYKNFRLEAARKVHKL